MKVEQKHARILREGLAKIHNHLPPQLQAITLNALDNYAKAIFPYCEHPEESFVAAQNKFVCLDCCRRREPEGNEKILLAIVKEVGEKDG